jgi:hypothetical protein
VPVRHLAGCYLPAPRQATTLLHRSGLRPAHADLLCRLLTSARRSGRITPPSVLTRTPCRSPVVSCHTVGASTPDLSSPPQLWMEGFAVACQLAPSVPHLVSGSCPSPRTFVPRFLQTPPRGDALALPLSFGSTHTWTGDFHPRAWQHARHTRLRHQPHAVSCASAACC